MARSTAAQGVQIGRETAAGTPVPANKRLGSLGVMLSSQVESDAFRPKGVKYPTVVTANKEWAGGDLEGTPTYDELVYPLSGVFTAATVSAVMDGDTETGAFEWLFSPASTGADAPVTFTLEAGDDTQAERMAHGLVTDFDLDISRSEISLGGSMIGQRLEQGVTLTANPDAVAEDLVPILPGQVCIYVADDRAGLEDRATSRQGTALSVHPQIGGRFEPVWYLNCVLDSFATFVEAPEPDFTLDYLVEANANGMAWLDRFRTGQTQYVRIEATGPVIHAGADATTDVRYLLQWDFAVKVLEPGEKSDEDGVYAIAPSLQVVHDPSWGRATQVRVVNTVPAL